MCGPGQLFFQCGPEMPKGWTPLYVLCSGLCCCIYRAQAEQTEYNPKRPRVFTVNGHWLQLKATSCISPSQDSQIVPEALKPGPNASSPALRVLDGVFFQQKPGSSPRKAWCSAQLPSRIVLADLENLLQLLCRCLLLHLALVEAGVICPDP